MATTASDGPIALFGGSFNPPHVVHGMVCLYLLQTGCSEVWVIPTFAHAFAKPLATFEDRLAMCRSMVEPLGARVKVLDIEARLAKPSYTIDTVCALKAIHSEATFQWVVGSDILDELDRWKRVDELKALVDFRVLHRTGYATPKGSVAFPEVSSTAIRRALAEGQDPGALLPVGVLGHIRRRGLYQAIRPPGSGAQTVEELS